MNINSTPAEIDGGLANKEQKFSTEVVIRFSKQLIENIDKALEAKPIGADENLTDGMLPSLAIAAKETMERSQKLIPREPLFAVIWAVTGIRLSEDKLALDRYEGIAEELDKLQPLTSGESINLSLNDLQDIGTTLGELLAHHALAGRSLKRLKPNLGDLGYKRSELQIESKDKLRFLDTVLQEISIRPVSKK